MMKGRCQCGSVLFKKGEYRLRKLMWFTIGFAAACAAGVYLSVGIWLSILCIVAAIPLFLLKKHYAKIAAFMLLGVAVGGVWLFGYDSVHLQVAKQYDGQTLSAQVTVTDYSYDTGYGVAADGELVLDGRRFRVCLYLAEGEKLSPGDTVQGDLRLRLTTDDSLQGATYHQGDGIFLLVYVRGDAKIYHADSVPAKCYPAVLRRHITDILDSTFPEDALAFARALLLGDSSLLSYELDTAFKLSGIRHVIAVSGLHVSILFSLVYMLCGKRRIPTALFGLPVLFLFAAVAGFTPSVVRACMMQGLMILGLLLKKEYDPPTALSFAVLVMLSCNPMTITSVSFQLSVGCLIGIFLFYQKMYNYLIGRFGVAKGMSVKSRLLRWVCGSASVTLSAMIATTPLSAWYFGSISIVGILTNLVTLWVISFIFYGIMLACAVGAIWPSVGAAIAWLTSWPIRYVQTVASILSGSVFSAVYTCSIYVVAWLVFTYVLLTAFLLSGKKRPVLLTACVLTGLVVSLALSWLEPRLDDYRVTVLDVGQGQAILLQCGDGNYLVDCGGDTGEMAADTVSQRLLSQGITRLDGLILTHYDSDHADGVLPLLSRIETEALYLPDIGDDNGIRDTLKQEYSERIIWIREDVILSGDDISISLFPPEQTDGGNESCLCVLFQTENCDILITGDMGTAGEQALLDRVELPKLELLVVGHHGSSHSTGFPLLGATKPDTAVISVGEDNFYGHPSEDVLFRLKLFGCSIWRTDLDGTIIFRG